MPFGCKVIAVFCIAGLFACAEDAPTASRSLAFDSKVEIRKNRDLEVSERIEISNEDGFFDNGLHRYLFIKKAGMNERSCAQRLKTTIGSRGLRNLRLARKADQLGRYSDTCKELSGTRAEPLAHWYTFSACRSGFIPGHYRSGFRARSMLSVYSKPMTFVRRMPARS